MKDLVTTSFRHGVAVVVVNNPPVNALGTELRRQLHAHLSACAADPDVSAIVLTGTGRNFIAGADLAELSAQPALPSVALIIELLEAIEKPTVAAINGNALGGGLEIAMACRRRVAVDSARLGLPEVRLGLIPGAGGTQRLPRLIGPLAALEMIVGHQIIGSDAAARLGLIDAVCLDDAVDAAIRLVSDATSQPKASDRTDRLATDLSAFDDRAAELLKAARHNRAANAAYLSVRDAVTEPFDRGLAQERQRFVELVDSAESRALRHLFLAERRAARIDPTALVRPVNFVGILGAGTMGGGIAMAFLNAGVAVVLCDATEEGLARGLAIIRRNYETSRNRGGLSDQQVAARLALLSTGIGTEPLSECDLIIEAVYEDMALKKRIFAELDRIAKPGAILATNTSWLDINEIAAVTQRQPDVLGMHFFSPANVMKLLEVVRCAASDSDVVATAMSVGKRIGKTPVTVGVGYGFVGNRMLQARNAELEQLMLEGAMPEQIDAAFRDFGWPMGPFQMTDLAGLDIGWRNRKAHGKVAPIADALSELGRFGQKTGKGFYLYEGGSRTGKPDPEVTALIVDMASRAGTAQRQIEAEEIIERTHYPLVNEGLRVLEEGIARNADDIDVIWTNGYGFPAIKGGPMHWAESVGWSRIAATLQAYSAVRPLIHLTPVRKLPV
ncbi:3-hydroxyacyl-CoA dehydrogenase NAD-binding domain-containing protein [Corticibacterium sp. UT-5YL-CI-8]|nr:3-hydroxyacyl-CoA dehydrogenase NAD-binding domain-containing protein [Tianweitania sp. UT-5YL-CI-8]